MHEIFNMLLAVFDRAALMLICLFFLIRIRLFRELLHKSAHSPKELLAVTAIFSLFALFSTWSGVPVEGSLVNVRIIAVMSGGILFGPWVGIITGVIAGIHRYLIDIGGVTAIPCFITSILAGCISGWINLKIPKAQRWRVGILGGMLCETLTMILVIVWAPTTALGIDIVSKIGIPMILGSVCIGFIVLLVQSVEGEKEASAARQAKLALDIANFCYETCYCCYSYAFYFKQLIRIPDLLAQSFDQVIDPFKAFCLEFIILYQILYLHPGFCKTCF